MAINCYCGLQGSGKSFETVRSVILPAIRSGRRVVTNIEGLNYELIQQYLKKKHPNDDIDHYGQLVHVLNTDVEREYKPNTQDGNVAFFPVEGNSQVASIVKPGDILVIDEAWRFWGTDKRAIPVSHMTFFRMHRHYADEKGRTCDVVLVTQDITGLHRSVKNVIEFSFRMHKLKSLGMATSYRVECYEGWKHTKKTRNDTYNHKYDKEIFPLYKSYDSGTANETNIDKRQNILNNPRIWFIAIAMVIGLIASISYLYWFFTKPPKQTNKPASAQNINPKQKVDSNQLNPKHTPSQNPKEQKKDNEYSDEFRLAGKISGNHRLYVIVDNRGRIRYESPSRINGVWPLSIVNIDEKKVTTFSGLPENIEKNRARFD